MASLRLLKGKGTGDIEDKGEGDSGDKGKGDSGDKGKGDENPNDKGDDNSEGDDDDDEDPSDEDPCDEDDDSEGVQIFVGHPKGKTITIIVEASHTTNNTKAIIKNMEGIAMKRQRLIYQGQQLEDGYTISGNGIQKEPTLHLTMTLRGGGKRPKQDKSETILSKDEKIQANIFAKDKNMFILTNMATANPIVNDILANIAKIDKAVSQKGAMKEMYKLLSRETLDDLLTSLSAHRDIPRLEGLVTAMFVQDLQNEHHSCEAGPGNSREHTLLCRRADLHQGVLRQEV